MTGKGESGTQSFSEALRFYRIAETVERARFFLRACGQAVRIGEDLAQTVRRFSQHLTRKLPPDQVAGASQTAGIWKKREPGFGDSLK